MICTTALYIVASPSYISLIMLELRPSAVFLITEDKEMAALTILLASKPVTALGSTCKGSFLFTQ